MRRVTSFPMIHCVVYGHLTMLLLSPLSLLHHFFEWADVVTKPIQRELGAGDSNE